MARSKYEQLINPLTPKLYSFQTTFSICMPTMHHIFISVRALTPKLNPSALAAIISRLVTLTTPTHSEPKKPLQPEMKTLQGESSVF